MPKCYTQDKNIDYSKQIKKNKYHNDEKFTLCDNL